MLCWGLCAEHAAKIVVKEAIRSKGLKDVTTSLVVDIIPSTRCITNKSNSKIEVT